MNIVELDSSQRLSQFSPQHQGPPPLHRTMCWVLPRLEERLTYLRASRWLSSLIFSRVGLACRALLPFFPLDFYNISLHHLTEDDQSMASTVYFLSGCFDPFHEDDLEPDDGIAKEWRVLQGALISATAENLTYGNK
jgi:hypothetical protein